jgi:FKBP-type peptidyl-prolyl cis-trans isomerase
MKFSLCSLVGGVVVFAVAACDSRKDSAAAESAAGAKTGDAAGAAAAGAGSAGNGSMAGKSGPREASAKPAAITTASGLKYTVMNRGTGTVHPKATDTVTVHYHGTLLNGTVFDSSVDRGQPASFPLNAVIKGWTEGVQLMKQGDKFKFEIPADLAYGAASPSPAIPPNSTLVFEVELLEIK